MVEDRGVEPVTLVPCRMMSRAVVVVATVVGSAAQVEVVARKGECPTKFKGNFNSRITENSCAAVIHATIRMEVDKGADPETHAPIKMTYRVVAVVVLIVAFVAAAESVVRQGMILSLQPPTLF
jgi:hypothetical protein